MWILRRVHKISWSNRTINKAVLSNTTRKLIWSVKYRETSYFHNVITNTKYELVLLAIEGEIDRKTRYWPKKNISVKTYSWLIGISKSSELIRLGEDKSRFNEVNDNLSRKTGHQEEVNFVIMVYYLITTIVLVLVSIVRLVVWGHHFQRSSEYESYLYFIYKLIQQNFEIEVVISKANVRRTISVQVRL